MGGYATKSAGTSPVQQSDIIAAIERISHLSSINVEDLHLLGSTGKSPWSGDIDLAIDVSVYDPEIVKHSMSLAGPEVVTFHDMSSLGIQSYAIKFKDQIIQVDLMFTSNLDWAKFAYWSPYAIESDYKGAIRTMLLMGVTAEINQPGIDLFKYDNENLIIRIGRTFDLNEGVRRIFQYRKRRVNGVGWVKSMTTTTLAELEDLFPEIRGSVTHDDIVISDPTEALALMFGQRLRLDDVRDAESVIRCIIRCFPEEQQERIFRKVAARAKIVEKKMKIPGIIKQFF